MKHVYLTFFALCVGVLSYGQSIELSENFFDFSVDGGFDYGDVTLTNNGSEAVSLAVRLERRCHADDGTGVQFCFGLLCHGPYDVDTAIEAGGALVQVGPGESTTDLTAHLWVNDGGWSAVDDTYTGEGSAWRLYYYDISDPSNEVYMDVLFGDCDEQFQVVSVAELATTSFNVFPNPATTQVTIDFESQNGGSYTIYDLTGKVMARENTTTSLLTVDTSALTSGIYFIEVGTLRKRLVIQ
ncbi:MAG: T9SS type A sorting domain-containing protein [Flavobacteriales bacterium]|nr:T9SS type A sorting domain-containing protein [Flavobacteriales bacterium]